MHELACCSGTKSHISKNTGFNVKIIQNYDTEVIFTVSNILIYGFVLGFFWTVLDRSSKTLQYTGQEVFTSLPASLEPKPYI